MKLSRKIKMYKNFDDDFEVCSCSLVTLKEIKDAICLKQCDTIEKLGNLTDAGTICKCCVKKENDYTEMKKLFLEELVEHYTHE